MTLFVRLQGWDKVPAKDISHPITAPHALAVGPLVQPALNACIAS